MLNKKIELLNKYGYYNTKYTSDIEFELLMLEAQGIECKYNKVKNIIHVKNFII